MTATLAHSIGIDEDPRPLWFLAEAGLRLHQACDIDAAGRVFHALTLLSPQEPLGWLGLAKVALDRHEPREAVRLATAAVRSVRHIPATRAESHFVLGRAYALQGRLKEAMTAFERAASADSTGYYGILGAESRDSLQQFLAPPDNP